MEENDNDNKSEQFLARYSHKVFLRNVMRM